MNAVTTSRTVTEVPLPNYEETSIFSALRALWDGPGEISAPSSPSVSAYPENHYLL
jgi:hypothetical protein